MKPTLLSEHLVVIVHTRQKGAIHPEHIAAKEINPKFTSAACTVDLE